MSDQGEKIVFLARELLNAGFADQAAQARKLDVTLSFKALCLTTLLAAAGGGFVTAWTHAGAHPLTRYEKTEIDALIFYAVKMNGVNEDELRRAVAQKTGVARVEDLTSDEFAAARRFLQEQTVDR